jgi:hypothetical protein
MVETEVGDGLSASRLPKERTSISTDTLLIEEATP